MADHQSGPDVRSKPDGEFVKPLVRKATGVLTLGRFVMTLSPFINKLSIVTAYVAVAFVGAIVLGVF